MVTAPPRPCDWPSPRRWLRERVCDIYRPNWYHYPCPRVQGSRGATGAGAQRIGGPAGIPRRRVPKEVSTMDLTNAEWRKSSYSATQTNCVEAARNLRSLPSVTAKTPPARSSSSPSTNGRRSSRRTRRRMQPVAADVPLGAPALDATCERDDVVSPTASSVAPSASSVRGGDGSTACRHAGVAVVRRWPPPSSGWRCCPP
jgi:hypothetical protein